MTKNVSRRSRIKKKKKDKSQAHSNPPPPMPQVPNTSSSSTAPTVEQLTSFAPPLLSGPLLPEHLATPKVLYEQCTIMKPPPDLPSDMIDYGKRRFHPRLHYASYFSTKDMQVPQGPYFFLACPNSPQCPCCGLYCAHYECPVISIYGICEKDKNGARSAGSIFLGPNNKHNCAIPLKGDDRQTNQIAELSACIYALQLVNKNLNRWKKERDRDSPSKLAMVVIKSDSAYIVNGIAEHVFKWKTNGWKNCKGQPVANVEDWKILDALVEKLEQQIRVKFWLVSREENADAENGAKAALGHGMEVCRAQNALGRMKL